VALLDAVGVTVRFGGVTAVDDASVSAEAGTVTGLIGPNGAGKTTLFNVLSGLQPPTAGRVRFKGQDVTKSTVDHRATMGMARTFQRLEAFGSLTVRENVQVARDIHAGPRTWLRFRKDRRADELLELVGIERYGQQRADSVPTGVARLLEIARALAIEPDLLLLDEPSSGLDEAETDEFGALLRRLVSEGRTVLLVEHDMDLVMSVCDLIHVLEFGKVIAMGTADQIRSDAAVQAAYLGFSDQPPTGSDPSQATDAGTFGAQATAVTGAAEPAETTLTMPAMWGDS
jgi:branched-chain amino acid transport system ATP-binding protein